MNNNLILLTSLLFASSVTLAGPSLLDSAKQTVKTAETVKEVGKATPNVMQDLAVDAAKQKAQSALPDSTK